MNLRIAMCEALVDGWHGDWWMSRVIGYAWVLTDKTPENEAEKYRKAEAAMKVKHLHAADKAQVWIARNMPHLNEALWNGRKRDTCIALAKKALGVNAGRAMQISVRERDTRHSWSTVK